MVTDPVFTAKRMKILGIMSAFSSGSGQENVFLNVLKMKF
jgi:hypothetical protein